MWAVLIPGAANGAPGGLEIFAGTGAGGSSGDGGPAREATLAEPPGVAVGRDGTVYVSDATARNVRAIGRDGRIRTVAGAQQPSSSAGPTGPVPATEAALGRPYSLAVGPDGTLYIADVALLRVFAVTPDGRLSAFAGTGVNGDTGDGGPATQARIGPPRAVAAGPDGTVYIADQLHGRIRAVRPDGTISTVAGSGKAAQDAAGGSALNVALPGMESIAVDPEGTLWITDAGTVRRLANGTVSTVVYSGPVGDHRWKTSTAPLWPPPETPLRSVYGVATDGATVYLLGDHGLQRMDADGTLTPPVPARGSVDQIAVGASGEVYVADRRMRQVYLMRVDPLADGDGNGSPWWLWWLVAACAVVLVVGVAVVVAARRRRAHRVR
jgi:sugar lactone lactonase YvrE